MPDIPIPKLARDDLAELRWFLARMPPRPWRCGARHWELVDADGRLVARLETGNSSEAVEFLCRIVALAERAAAAGSA